MYYSTLDWYRSDYPYETGRTGKGTGRTGKSNYASYLQFMKNQLTELLTNYGEIMCIWFDGHWDQTNPEGHADRASRIDWKYDEIYPLIHQLQPKCMIGNNHHLSPIPGEDFQMFERDLPGENKAGLSFQTASQDVPLESCETINGSWGYNITDRRYKTVHTGDTIIGWCRRSQFEFVAERWPHAQRSNTSLNLPIHWPRQVSGFSKMVKVFMEQGEARLVRKPGE